MDAFRNLSEEKIALKWFRSHPHLLISSNERWIGNLIKVKEKIYKAKYFFTITGNRSSTICVRDYQRVNLEDYVHLAVKNLMSVVNDRPSMGDRMLIKNIAKDSFYRLVDVSLRSGRRSISLEKCLKTDLCEFALNQLSDYGFRLKEPKIDIVKP